MTALLVSLLNLAGIGALIWFIDTITSNESQELFTLSQADKKTFHTCQGNWLSSDCIYYPVVKVQKALNTTFSQYDRQQRVVIFGIGIVLSNVLKITSLILTFYLIGTSVLKVSRDFRLLSYSQLLRLPLFFYHRRHTGTFMNRVIGDSETINNALGEELNEIFVNIFYIVTHVIFLLFLSVHILSFILFLTLILNGPIQSIAKKISKITHIKLEALGNLSASTYEIISGMRIIRAFGYEHHSLEKFQKINERVADYSLKGHYYSAVGPAIVEVVSTFIFLSTLLVVSYLIYNTDADFSQGKFFAFFLGLIFILGPIKRISQQINFINISLKATERIYKFIQQPTDQFYKYKGNKPFPAHFQSLQLQSISTVYQSRDNKNILSDVHLTIHRGEKIGIVGRSGAGKSTLIDVCMQFVTPKTGKVSFLLSDSDEAKEISINEILRSERAQNMAAVFQDPFLFNATIYENITYSSEMKNHGKTKQEQLRNAVRQAMMQSFVEELPKKYATNVGERGLMLSGGQRQRLALARVFFQRPSILFLDEATSHLDIDTELKVFANLRREFHDQTLIICSHRIASIQNLDRLVVMEGGKIIENGNHDELMQKKGVYYQLYHEK